MILNLSNRLLFKSVEAEYLLDHFKQLQLTLLLCCLKGELFSVEDVHSVCQ